MSSIEERLARDIAAVTGGVVMTDSDLRDARSAVDERIDARRQRSRRVVVGAVAAAVLVPVLAFVAVQTLGSDDNTAPPVAPVPPSQTAEVGDLTDAEEAFLTGAAPTPDLVEGVWRVDNGTRLLRFTADGAVETDDAGRLFSDPGVIGTYEIADGVISMTVDGGPASCAGQTLVMHASLPEPGLLRYVLTKPGTGNCASGAVRRFTLEQVLPSSRSVTGLDFGADPGWGPLPGPYELPGVWLAQGGGHLLEMTADGDYYVVTAPSETVDHGQWTLGDDRSRLNLVSAGDSPTCAEGDRLVLTGLELVDPGTSSIRGTVEQNTCGGAWTPTSWILLPHEGS